VIREYKESTKEMWEEERGVGMPLLVRVLEANEISDQGSRTAQGGCGTRKLDITSVSNLRSSPGNLVPVPEVRERSGGV